MPSDLETAQNTRFALRPRRAVFEAAPASYDGDIAAFEDFDLAYRTLCAILYNFVPTSGHPGGSISSGRIAQSLLFESMDYDFSDPAAEGADIICYAGGHKAMGLYALWALRDETVRIAKPDILRPYSRRRLPPIKGAYGCAAPLRPTPCAWNICPFRALRFDNPLLWP